MGTGGFGFAAAAPPRSELNDLADEFDPTVERGAPSVESRLSGFEGRAGTAGLLFIANVGEVASSCNRCRTGIDDCFSGDSEGFDLAGRAGTNGFETVSVGDLSACGLVSSFSSLCGPATVVSNCKLSGVSSQMSRLGNRCLLPGRLSASTCD